MTEDSTFFDFNEETSPGYSPPELIHASESGFTELYRVDKDGKFLALKALKAEFRGMPRYEGLLRKEYEITWTLSHPNIRQVYSFGHSGTLGNYIEMEWVDGMTLSEYITNKHPDTSSARKAVMQLCDALAYIHSRQTVHRDIKPSNILITHNGNNVKLIDFGFSDTDRHSLLKAPAGTLSFAAPELLRSENANCRADVYSLGKVIALLLPSERRIIRRCTYEDRERRFPDADSVRKALAKRRPGWSTIMAVALTAAAAAAVMLFMLRPGHIEKVVPPENKPEQTITNTEDIDEIFRRATEMIQLEDNQ